MADCIGHAYAYTVEWLTSFVPAENQWDIFLPALARMGFSNRSPAEQQNLLYHATLKRGRQKEVVDPVTNLRVLNTAQ